MSQSVKTILVGDEPTASNLLAKMRARGMDTANIFIAEENNGIHLVNHEDRTQIHKEMQIEYNLNPYSLEDIVKPFNDEPEKDSLKLAKNKIKFASKPHKRRK